MEIMKNVQNTEHDSGIQMKAFNLIEIHGNTAW